MITILCLLASLLLYDSLGYFASVMPVIVGVAMHKLIEHVWEDHKRDRELNRLRLELNQLRSK